MDKEKILVIDDEVGFLEVLSTALKTSGYEVVTAVDGEEGLSKAKSEKPNLVICDIKMPKRDGYGVLKAIREELDPNLPVIMITAVEDFKSVEAAYECNADFFLSKPVEIAMLKRNVRTLLNLRGNKGAH